MSTKEQPGPFDGMAKARPDEPVFTLRAHDPLAAILAHEWVDRRRKAIREAFAREEITEAKRDLELIQCKEAEEIAWAMERWRKGELAEMVETIQSEEAPTYSGHEHAEEEISARARYETIKRAGTLLNNGVAAIHEASEEVLSSLGPELHTTRAVLTACRDRVKAVAAHIAPKRASYHPGQELPEPFDPAEGGSMADFQAGVSKWMVELFGEVIAMDKLERIMRFLEEALELAQSEGMTEAEALRVVSYVWSRPAGEPFQEVGGTMITLAAYCFRREISLQDAALTEYHRINTPEMREHIFAKQAAKRAAGLTSDGGFRADPSR